MRKVAREIAFMLIYEEQFNKNLDVEFSFDYLKNDTEITGENVVLDEEDREYVMQLLRFYSENMEEIKTTANRNLYGYEPDRVFKVDYALLILAVTEIFYFKTPAPVVVNEVVELAKKYSTDKSSGFINGILGAIIKELPQG